MTSNSVIYFQSQSNHQDQLVARAELFDAEARDAARALVKFEPTQLRRFYSVVSALRNEAKGDPDFPDDQIKARLALLKAHAHYSWARDSKKIPRYFLQFIDMHVNAVRTRNDFLLGFAPHFEAVVAYHRYEREMNR
ncbi:MAG: type III-A CRISPR-associated protein Csm2 [Rhodospirillales bacterium]|nr:type III-A CRISPR-associated protein Csm2 [Rhodospirillales bacterium]